MTAVLVVDGMRMPKVATSEAVEVTIPIRTVSESNARGHWAARARRAKLQRNTVALVVRASRPPEPPCVVTLTRIAPSNGLDDDNLRGALKACRDAVADVFGRGDGAKCGVEWRYAQERGKAYGVRVRVER